MATARTYLDYNATAPLRAEAAEAMTRAFHLTGNASSVHAEGRKARAAVEEARRVIAGALGVSAEGVIFTGSGTEANSLAIAQAEALGASAILYGAGEHACVMAAAEASSLPKIKLPLQSDGVVDRTAFEEALAGAGEKPFVALQHANNETGVLQPLAEIAEKTREAGGILTSDLVQSFGKVPFAAKELGAHMVAVSAHKIGGPKGVGALVLTEDLPIRALIPGGGQERRRRGGTENVAGIAGFAAAVEAAQKNFETLDAQRAIRDAFEAKLKTLVPDVTVFGEGAARLANTSCFAAPGAQAETLLMKLDLAGFAASSGAACSSGKVALSHVLEAMGVPDDLSRAALRMSIGAETDLEDVLAFAQTWADAVCSQGGVKTALAG
ncbi:cysteine desulfurase family protein [Tepidicaulis sp. LMO-SS28]|uniref:cysteine desulfurase family protein n=1 Tax=Tepidicaulis sp. LMO-SS28 TaxID=3447455 RepID=UPI003EE10D06